MWYNIVRKAVIMNILLNIEELFPYMSNGNIRLPLEMVIVLKY